MEKIIIYFSLLCLFVSCGNTPQEENASKQTSQALKGAAQLNFGTSFSAAESLDQPIAAYNQSVKAILNASLPIQPMAPAAYDTPVKKLAQDIALSHPEFVRDVFHKETKEALHNEITVIRALSAQEIKDYQINLAPNSCYKVEMYNYFYNAIAEAFVDINAKKVLGVRHRPAVSPEHSLRAKNMASTIAIAHPEVAKALSTSIGVTPSDYQVEIKDSNCERSRHYCLAIVYTKGAKKLWVLVDMNDKDVVGWQWIENDDEKRPTIVTERTLQNDFVMENYCDVDNVLEKGDWQITYSLKSSDGLEIKNVKYKNQEVITSAKLVDWHVSYTFNGGFGYSDAIGCPMFSSAAVVAFKGAEVEELADGAFALIQDFRSPVWPLACNYRYENRFEFYADGSFRILGVNHGIGCGADGEYRPVFRIDMAGKEETFAQWNGQDWEQWTQEKWNLQDQNSQYTPENYLYKFTSAAASYFIEPGNGQFQDGGRGDNAYTYITTKKVGVGEGEVDMPTFGECCNKDHRQGPETFMQPAEALTGQELIIWYVPQMYNSKDKGQEYCWAATHVDEIGQATYTTWKGSVGPKFIRSN